MTLKEKAKELVDQFYKASVEIESLGDYSSAKQCALICVDELIKNNQDELDFIGVAYWKEVKQEINKL